jgi:hypothetical protein
MKRIFNPKTNQYEWVKDTELRRVTDPEDPNRCGGSFKNGQCPHVAVEGSKYCCMHGGWRAAVAKEKSDMAEYLSGRWAEEIKTLSENDGVYSLKQNIGVLTLLIEKIMGDCNSNADLIARNASISDLVVKCDKLVTSCSKLQKDLGEHLDRGTVMRMADACIAVIGKYITDPEEIESASNEILESIK